MADKSAPKKSSSAFKRVKQAEKRRLRNQSVKTKMKTHTTKLADALKAKNKDEIDEKLKGIIKVINIAASKGIIHKNTASRKISRLTKQTNIAL